MRVCSEASPRRRQVTMLVSLLLFSAQAGFCARSAAGHSGILSLGDPAASGSALGAAEDVGDITFAEAVNSAAFDTSAIFENKLYACSTPNGASVVRLAQPRKCHKYTDSTNMTEGIAVTFKQNIAPLIFNATLYYKHITTVTTWKGFGLAQITNEYRTRVNIGFGEIKEDIDGKGECVTRAAYNRNKVVYEAYDNDVYGVYKPLVPTLLRSPSTRSFHTTNVTQRRTALGYRTSTTVDCVVEYMQARSVYPYTYFGLATGNTLEISPFYKSSDKHSRYNLYAEDRVYEALGYQARDLETRVLAPPHNRNFVFEDEFTVAWDQMDETTTACTMAKWLEIPEAVRVSYNKSFHFNFKDLTATLVASKTPFNISRLHLGGCVPRIANETIEAIYGKKYKNTHVRSGGIEYYLANGGFLIAFQRLVSNDLAELYLDEAARQNHSAVSRSKRAAPSGGGSILSGPAGDLINTHTSATFAMLQFTYDKIQKHVNMLIGNLLEAWCEMQNRQLVVWHEIKKLNPASLMTSMYGHAVAARLLGDVLAVSKCLEIPIENVVMQDSMRVPGDPSMCYVRPVLVFKYPAAADSEAMRGRVARPANNSDVGGSQQAGEAEAQQHVGVHGQLGEHNEILHGRTLIEPCKASHRRYFLFGANYLLYEDYKFIRQVNASEIEEISSTFVNLDVTLLEDLDFVPLAVYTREELRDVGTLNYDEVVRYNNLYNKMFRDLDTALKFDDGLATLRAIGEFLTNTLGGAGKVLGNVVMGAAAAIISTVSGISSFLANPFAALGIGIAVIVCVIMGLLAFRYVMTLRANPVQTLFPGIIDVGEKARQHATVRKDEDASDKELAERVLRGLEILSFESEVRKRREKAAASAKSTLAKRIGQFLRHRKTSTKDDTRKLLKTFDDEDYYYDDEHL
ncbi:glycoprotein B [Psittacid alphaherpesvirus 1]|uniref:Envelope glycoprotein B n=1 Tax=Psittacid herpesvirus 1 (isolate Amazon parrot/-/97-0001/1997) TaxID=670426 RepID=GB_PSHV1|nr:envelope glycoprotein B [Psittacid alphaherpesvirus 1]Q6UDK4.1 RecName: Full=Envelope glycoprotein B; Short=gB; Flags: Precursor [Psittacid herpesvirus 1 Amazon parrot/1997]AAQ73706.1 glycoprotein B [Psittacid alphaherpesvirus 1]